MKKILSAILFISLAQITSAQVLGGGLTGSGTRILQVNSGGELTPLAPGTSSQVLFGNSTWGSLPSVLWTTSGSNIFFNTGYVGIGNTNPQYPLDVTGNARITGTLTAGGINATSSNLNITTPAIFTSTVTLSGLGNGTSNQRLSINAGGNIITGGANSCDLALPSWTIGGDNLTGLSPTITNGDLALGTCDQTDLVLKAGGHQLMWLKPYGSIGIRTNQPGGLVHINTLGIVPTAIGLVVDDQNNEENAAEFTVNCDGTTRISVLPSNVYSGNFNLDALSVNTQDPHFQGCLYCPGTGTIPYYNLFRVDRNTGHVGIGVAPGTRVSAYTTLTVSGDVSLANYNSNPSGNQTDGLNGIEILGGNKVPSRRGISTDDDGSNGNFNFYINHNQTAPAFNFKDGFDPAHPVNLMTLNAAGQLILGAQDSPNQNLPTSNSTHNTALLQVKGDVVVGKNGTANIFVIQSNWSDFVFNKDYKLMSLTDLEAYYKTNHHLPNVPSTKDIQEQGNNLGQTDAVLLQKIEENTLYIVELKKQLEEQKKLIEELAKKLTERK